MRLLSKAAVAALLTPSVLTGGMIPFSQLQTKAEKWCKSKYRPEAQPRTDHDLPLPIWFTDGKDAHGPYIALRCVDEDKLTDTEFTAYRDYVIRWQEIRDKDPTPPEKKRHQPTPFRKPPEAERSAPAAKPPLTVLPDPTNKKLVPALPYQLPDFLR